MLVEESKPYPSPLHSIACIITWPPHSETLLTRLLEIPRDSSREERETRWARKRKSDGSTPRAAEQRRFEFEIKVN
jgi:hypothetical protein